MKIFILSLFTFVLMCQKVSSFGQIMSCYNCSSATSDSAERRFARLYENKTYVKCSDPGAVVNNCKGCAYKGLLDEFIRDYLRVSYCLDFDVQNAGSYNKPRGTTVAKVYAQCGGRDNCNKPDNVTGDVTCYQCVVTFGKFDNLTARWGYDQFPKCSNSSKTKDDCQSCRSRTLSDADGYVRAYDCFGENFGETKHSRTDNGYDANVLYCNSTLCNTPDFSEPPAMTKPIGAACDHNSIFNMMITIIIGTHVYYLSKKITEWM